MLLKLLSSAHSFNQVGAVPLDVEGCSGLAATTAAASGEVVLRRSSRVLGSSPLESRPVVDLLDKIRADDPEVEVLKIHNCISADVSASVIDALLDALMLNNNCQALYIQNVSLGDEQLRRLAEVLRRGNIWCLNVGENSGISSPAWWWFVERRSRTHTSR